MCARVYTHNLIWILNSRTLSNALATGGYWLHLKPFTHHLVELLRHHHPEVHLVDGIQVHKVITASQSKSSSV
jgi:hypothetical protein